MATITGVVKALTGTVKAIAADGTERVLHTGDQVLQGEKILTADASSVVIEFSNGAVIDLGRNMDIALTEETLQDAAAAQAAGAGQAPEQAAEAQATAEEIQKALLEGKDVTQLEATAAGPAAGGVGGDSIHEELVINYVGGEFVPTYGFDTIGPVSSFPPPPEEELPIEEEVVDGKPAAQDDGPGINNEQFVTQDEDAEGESSDSVSGNILTNDNFGPDGPGNPPITTFTYDGGLGPINDVEINGSVATITEATGVWQLVIDLSTGAYTFTQFSPYDHEGAQDEFADGHFGYTIQDADGDTASAVLTIRIEDDEPSVVGNEPGAVSLQTDDADLGEGPDVATASFASAFSFDVDGGADGVASTSTSYALSLAVAEGTASGLLTSDGNNPIYFYAIDGDIVGSTSATEGGVGEGNTVFTLEVDDAGLVTLTQYQAIEHNVPESEPAYNDDTISFTTGLVQLTATLTVTDNDGDTASDSATLDLGGNVTFTDDGPAVTANVPTDVVTLTTDDADLGEGPDVATASFASAFSFNVDGGEDGAASTSKTYALGLAVADGTASGLLTSDGDLPIYLYEDNGVITGSTSATEGGVDGTNTVFTLSVSNEEGTAGEVTLTQYQAIEHNVPESEPAYNDDTVSLVNGLVNLTATMTVTDNDGDTASATSTLDLGGEIRLGSNINFTDDGPSVSANAPTDEGSLQTDDADLDEGPDVAAASFASAFTFTADAGEDGQATATTTYALSLAAGVVEGTTVTGLLTSDGNLPIYIYEDGGVITGSTSATEGGVDGTNTVFTLAVDGAGEVTLTQYQAIEHIANGDDGPEDAAVDGDFSDDIETLATGLVELTATHTVTDNDGDTASASATIDLGGNVTFTDDGPSVSANAPTDTVTLTTDDADLDEGPDVAAASFASAFTFTADAGEDGQATATTTYALSLAAGVVEGTTVTGLLTSDGNLPIYIYEDGGVITGSTSATEGGVDGTNTVFTLAVDGAGEVTLTQYQAIEHIANGDDGPEDAAVDGDFSDDIETLATGLVELTATHTVTDNDGDTASASATIDLGGNVTFTDDGPSVSANAPTDTVTLTTDDADLDEGPDVAAASFASAFTFTADAGEDGQATAETTYALSLAAGVVEGTTVTGLLTSDGNLPIYIYEDGGVITGSTSATEGGVDGTNTVFTLAVDGAGEVTLTQYQAIEHSVPESEPAYNDDTISLANGLVELTATHTVTDNDGDTASDSAVVDLGGNVTFTDDGPSVEAATNAASVDEDDLSDGTDPAPKDSLSTTGDLNINFGADGGTIALSADGATWDAETQTLTGAYWHVVLNDNGTYTFTLDDNTLTHPNGDNTEAPVDVTFSYTATDGDGDTVSGDLTVQVVDDMPIAVDEPTQILTESHINETDWLAGTVAVPKDGNNVTYVKVTTINELSGGDTLKINWDSSGSATVNWQLRDSNGNVVASGTANSSSSLSAVLISTLVTDTYELWVDSSKDITVTDVHTLHTVIETNDGNVITGDPGADTVGADGAEVYSITYVNASNQTVTEVLGDDGEANVVTQYGTLHIEADGDYLYTVNMNAVPDNDLDSQVNDDFTYTLRDGDGDTDTANMNFVINDVKAPSVLDVTMLTNTNNQVQPVILTFVDQNDPTHAFSRLLPLGAQGQQGTFTPDTGFDINNNHNYIVGVEAATSDTKVLLTDLTIEGVPLFGQATGNGGGTIQMQLDDGATGTGGQVQTGIAALIQPNTPPAVQPVTDSTDGGAGNDSITDNTSGTVNYLYGASGADTLQGSSGSEILNGGDGADNVSGGGGNDILVYGSNDTNLDGGAGIDVLRIDDGAMELFLNPSETQAVVDMTGKTAIHDVEVLLITDDAEGSATKGTTLILNAADVLNFTDDAIPGINNSINHTLYVNGNSSDQVNMGTGWTDGGVSGDFHTYTQSVNGVLVTLNVETEVSVNPDALT